MRYIICRVSSNASCGRFADECNPLEVALRGLGEAAHPRANHGSSADTKRSLLIAARYGNMSRGVSVILPGARATPAS
jgi:hypothetical protein